MVLRTHIIVSTGLAAAIAFAAGVATAQQIVVVKGVESQVVDTGAAGEPPGKAEGETPAPAAEPSTETGAEAALPEIVRGDIPPPPAEPAAAAEDAPAGDEVEWRPIGGRGRGLWLLNRDRGLLVGCRMVGSGQVGKPKDIRCTEERRISVFDR